MSVDMSYFNVVEVGRFMFFKRMMDLVKDVEGDVVECGVGRGISFSFLALLCRHEGKGRRLWGFDSFEGFPEPTEKDSSARRVKKGQNYFEMERVLNRLSEIKIDREYMDSKINLVKGFFDQTLHKYDGDGIALLHIDVDLYRSYLDVFNGLYDEVMPGGVIAFDEYMDGITHLGFPGAKKAIDEFFSDKPFDLRRDKHYGKYYVVKPRS